jgi:hypothetical protein
VLTTGKHNVNREGIGSEGCERKQQQLDSLKAHLQAAALQWQRPKQREHVSQRWLAAGTQPESEAERAKDADVRHQSRSACCEGILVRADKEKRRRKTYRR